METYDNEKGYLKVDMLIIMINDDDDICLKQLCKKKINVDILVQALGMARTAEVKRDARIGKIHFSV